MESPLYCAVRLSCPAGSWVARLAVPEAATSVPLEVTPPGMRFTTGTLPSEVLPFRHVTVPSGARNFGTVARSNDESTLHHTRLAFGVGYPKTASEVTLLGGGLLVGRIFLEHLHHGLLDDLKRLFLLVRVQLGLGSCPPLELFGFPIHDVHHQRSLFHVH